MLLSFGVINMFTDIDNKSGLKSLQDVLLDSNFDLDSTQCIVDALEICLTCNNSMYRHFYGLMVWHKILTCLVPKLILPWSNMTL